MVVSIIIVFSLLNWIMFEVLDIGKITNIHFQYTGKPTDPTRVTDELVAMQQRINHEKGITLAEHRFK
jgi:hypothetical protein